MYAFSFCLYNPYNPYYYVGLLENIELIRTHFHGWGIYVYLGNDVPPDFRETLIRLDCRVRDTGVSGHVNMVHRFFAIDETDVELMMVRDADSRVNWKDRWAIQQFLHTDKKLHAIRDNKVHTAPILGGLWGLRKPLFSIRALHAEKDTGVEVNLGYDQNFLANAIYPLFQTSMLIHSSISWKYRPEEVLTPFPFRWNSQMWCGQSIDVNPPPVRFSGVSILRRHNGH
jgi:hypothetical protein